MHWLVLHHLLRPIKWLYKKLTVKETWPELPPGAAPAHEPTVIINVTEAAPTKWEQTKYSTGEVPRVQVIPQVVAKVRAKKTLKKPLKKTLKKSRAKLKPEHYKLPVKTKKKK
jgi:hypothetical protein